MVHSCCYMGCKSNSIKDKTLSFHRFPGAVNIKEAWLQAIGKPKWTPTKSNRVCSIHFEDKLFFKSINFNPKIRLKKYAVPISFSKSENMGVSMDRDLPETKHETKPKVTFANKYVNVDIKPVSCNVKIQACMTPMKVGGTQTDGIKWHENKFVQTEPMDVMSASDTPNSEPTYAPSQASGKEFESQNSEYLDSDDPLNERKNIVFESSLSKLFKYCRLCQTSCSATVTCKGTVAIIRTKCLSCGYDFTW